MIKRLLDFWILWSELHDTSDVRAQLLPVCAEAEKTVIDLLRQMTTMIRWVSVLLCMWKGSLEIFVSSLGPVLEIISVSTRIFVFFVESVHGVMGETYRSPFLRFENSVRDSDGRSTVAPAVFLALCPFGLDNCTSVPRLLVPSELDTVLKLHNANVVHFPFTIQAHCAVLSRRGQQGTF